METSIKDHASSASLSEKGEDQPTEQQVTVSSKRAHLTWAGVLPAIAVVGLTSGMATLILVWIRVRQFKDEELGYPSGFLHAIRKGEFTLHEGWKESKDGSELEAVMRILTFSVVAVSSGDLE